MTHPIDSSETSDPNLHYHQTAPRVCAVTMGDVWNWLGHGWRDMQAAGWVSLSYGLIFVFGGFLISGGLIVAEMPYLIVPMAEGFMLIGPLVALGFYDISRKLEQGESPTLWGALTAWRSNSFQLLTAGLVMMLFLMVWGRLAVIIYVVSFPYQTFGLAEFTAQLTTLDGIAFLITGTLIGGAMAVIAFVCNVTTLPMMLDRRADFFAAAALSVQAVLHNPRSMLGWAALIVIFTGVGLASAFIGLTIALPLIGHASWHAYRALIPPPPPSQPDT